MTSGAVGLFGFLSNITVLLLPLASQYPFFPTCVRKLKTSISEEGIQHLYQDPAIL